MLTSNTFLNSMPRGIFWVARAKDNMSYTVVEALPADTEQGIVRDQIIVLNTEKSRNAYPKTLRLVAARVDINGKEVEMTFISNNFKWAALLVWLLSRYSAFVSGWSQSFSRLMALLCSANHIISWFKAMGLTHILINQLERSGGSLKVGGMKQDKPILRVAVIGCGSRGRGYAKLAASKPERYALVAAADPVPNRVEQIRALSNDPDFRGYPDAVALLEDRPAADMVMVCTQDDDHYEHTMGAMEAGYDLLLEKPVSNSLEEIVAIEQKAEELRRRIVVCHVLRYSDFYLKVKQLIDGGVLGDLVSVHAIEGVGAWHFSHSFVRGHWAVMEETSPMILAKCCHDMDLLHWLIGRECRSIASVGALNYFKAANAPEGAPERCHQGCPVADECMYNAKRYLEESGKGWLAMVYDRVRTASDAEIFQWLETSPWGRCVYRCGNTAVDHQVLAMDFDDDISCSFTMTAFDSGRGIELFGTKARLRGGEFLYRSCGADIIVENHQGETIEKIYFEDHGGHLGGDEGLVDSLYARMVEWPFEQVKDELRQVVHGHRMAFAAEDARQTGMAISLERE